MKNFIAAISFGIFCAPAVYAEEICNVDLSNQDLVGAYTLTMGPGTMWVHPNSGGERIHDMPVQVGTATIAELDGALILFSDDIAEGGVLEIVLNPLAERRIDFTADPRFSPISSDDIATLIGCDDTSALPQYSGVGTVTGPIVVPNTTHFVVWRNVENDGVNAIGVYDSEVVIETGTIIMKVRFRLDPID